MGGTCVGHRQTKGLLISMQPSTAKCLFRESRHRLRGANKKSALNSSGNQRFSRNQVLYALNVFRVLLDSDICQTMSFLALTPYAYFN